MCVLRDCSVCECDDPPQWTKADDCTSQQIGQRLISVRPMAFDLWSTVKENRSVSVPAGEVVVDLRENPERFTGYDGESAAKVWDEVHNRNCFQPTHNKSTSGVDSGVCMSPAWRRVYNRLLSGLHASISLHIAHDYCLKRSTVTMGECDIWGPNVSVARNRVLDHSDRVENLYATFAVLLRAVVKAGGAISAAVPLQDAAFSQSLREWRDVLLPELMQMAGSCPKTFAEDEFASDSSMWVEMQGRLQHLAEIMRCVGCDRCKLWGTLQTQGLGAALRVLFQPGGIESLTRQEAVALVHTLERLSSSLVYMRNFQGRGSGGGSGLSL